MHVEGGYLAYGGTFSGPTNICNGVNLGGSACLKKVTDNSLVTEKASILSQLQTESSYYKGLATSVGASLVGDMNNKTFKYTGAATDLAVFNLSVSDLTGPNWSINLGLASKAVINVSGSIFNAGTTKTNGFSNSNIFNNVLWNFADAVQLNFGDSWYGSVLALNADITTGSNLNGAIAAKSYYGNGEIHQGSWNYTPPKVNVSEPSTLLLSLLGLSLILVGRARRK